MLDRPRLGGHVRDPDAGPFVGESGRQVGHRGGEPIHRQIPRRAVQHRVAQHAAGSGDRLGEDDGVLVRVQVEVEVEPGLVGEQHGAEPLPRGEVAGHGERDERAERAERDVGHQVHAEPATKSPWVLDSAVMGACSILRRGEHDAARLTPTGTPSTTTTRPTDPRHVAAATSRCTGASPVGGCPAAGFRLPRFHGCPGSGAMTVPTRVTDTEHRTWCPSSPLDPRADALETK